MNFLDDQRRQQANDIVAGSDSEQLPGAQPVDKIRIRHLHLETKHEALSAHILEHVSLDGVIQAPRGPNEDPPYP